jgi:transcriptional regulator with XRE-family HTH domain
MFVNCIFVLMEKLGKKIKFARKTKRITQNDLAKAIGVSDKSVSAYESGRIEPPLKMLEKIALSTDHSLEYFVGESIESQILAKLTEVEKLFNDIKSALNK